MAEAVRTLPASRHLDDAAAHARYIERPVTLADVLADEKAVHVFRHQIAAELALDWPERANGLRSCGEAGVALLCAQCDRLHVVPYRCNARSCPTCARMASAVAVERVAARAEWALERGEMGRRWEGVGRRRLAGWKMFTGTLWAEGEYGDDVRFHPRTLRRSILRVRRAWGPFWRSVPWGRPIKSRQTAVTYSPVLGKPRRRRTTRARRDTAFAMGLEVAPGGMVHLHAAIYGEWMERDYLWQKWETQIGTAGFIKIKKIRGEAGEPFRKSLHEVLKYVSKGEGRRRYERAASIELAMRGIRRVEVGGALRKVPPITQLDLVYEGAQQCVECGASRRWKWVGLRAPQFVNDNGGFGVDRWADIRDVPAGRGDMQATLHQGYFGGDPPPWMDEGSDEGPSLSGSHLNWESEP